ncbi:hypothetical protein [Zooshikella ganghwensis]|nr:hypothetical protein [Zooshikella ganghwensis]
MKTPWFRHGLDLLQQVGLQVCHCLKRIHHCLKLLIIKPQAPNRSFFIL